MRSSTISATCLRQASAIAIIQPTAESSHCIRTSDAQRATTNARRTSQRPTYNLADEAVRTKPLLPARYQYGTHSVAVGGCQLSLTRSAFTVSRLPHLRRDWAHPPATPVPGSGSPLPHLHRTGLGSSQPHLHRDRAYPMRHLRRDSATPFATSAPGLGGVACSSCLPL
jgi:hypothetical protein